MTDRLSTAAADSQEHPDPIDRSAPDRPVDTGPAPTSESTRGLILYAGGAAFLLYSSLLTRRSLVRRYKLGLPKFYQSNNTPYPRTYGFSDAVEAFGLATVNVCSVGIMMVGGWMWSLRIHNTEDLRSRLRNKIGGGARPGTKSKQEVDEEIEEWVAQVLARKAAKDRRKREGTSG